MIAFYGAIRLESDGRKAGFLQGKMCAREKKVKSYGKAWQACFQSLNFKNDGDKIHSRTYRIKAIHSEKNPA